MPIPKKEMVIKYFLIADPPLFWRRADEKAKSLTSVEEMRWTSFCAMCFLEIGGLRKREGAVVRGENEEKKERCGTEDFHRI